MTDSIEFYSKDSGKIVARVESSMVPPVGSKISIQGETWEIAGVTYALDHSATRPAMRANVDLIRA
jgi:hypothetical protein